TLTPFDVDVVMTCVEMISLYSRTSDELGARQIAEHLYSVDDASGYQRDRVGAALRRLHKAAVLEVNTGVGRYGRTVITFRNHRTPMRRMQPRTERTQPGCRLAAARRDRREHMKSRRIPPEYRYDRHQPSRLPRCTSCRRVSVLDPCRACAAVEKPPRPPGDQS